MIDPKAIRSIAINTFRETVRDKLLYSIIGFAVVIIAASLLAGSVSLGQDIRVIQTFGSTAIIAFLVFITVFISTQLLRREVERKTIYLTLTKPVSRESFYLGKFFGLALTIAASGAAMGLCYLLLLQYKTGEFSTPALLAVIFVILEAWLLTAVGLLFGSFTAPLSSAIYTFGLAIIGHSSATIWSIGEKAPQALKYPLQAVYYLFPNLEKFNFRNEIVYDLFPTTAQLVSSVGYFLAYTVALILIGLAIFRKNEF